MRARAVLAVMLLAGLALACRSTAAPEDELPFELALTFAGAAGLDAQRLERIVRAELARLEVNVLDKAAVDDAAFALELHYRSRGYAEARVEYTFEPGDPPRASFRIHEGSVVRVRELVIEGPAAIAPERVRALFEPMASGGIYDLRRLERALETLRDLYRAAGHLRVAIEDPLVEVDGQGNVALRLVLREGPIFRFRELEFRGGIPALARREAELARKYADGLYIPQVAPEIEHALEEDYRRRGHPDVAVRVQSQLDEASGDVRLVVVIAPGDPVRIAHFRLVGNARTKDSAILSVIGLERGAPYDSERLRVAFRELYATGLFESVSLELEGTGPERTLLVEVVEARSVQIRLEPGWGSYEGPRLLLGIEEQNFGGRGETLALEGTVSLKAKSARVSWIDRDFLGSRLTSETTFYVEQREEPSFEFARRGFGFFLRRNWREHWSSSAGYEYRPTDVTEDPSATPLPPDIDDDTSVAALSAALSFDDRDNPLSPTRGRQGRARLEWADDGLGSDTEFLRAQLEYTHLLRVGSESVLAASARTGVIAPFGTSQEIPLPERFFNGGENSVRSFREDELLPPGASGDPRGGEGATTLNLEWRRVLVGSLAAALFADVGNVAEDIEDYTRFAGFQSGLGLGLRYMLPIGPVRIDFAVNPDPEDDGDESVLHISVGFPF